MADGHSPSCRSSLQGRRPRGRVRVIPSQEEASLSLDAHIWHSRQQNMCLTAKRTKAGPGDLPDRRSMQGLEVLHAS